MVNKAVTRSLGDVRASMMLSFLLDKHSYYQREGGLIESEGEQWFYVTSATTEDELCLSYHQQRAMIKILTEAGCVMTKVMGLPAKTHFSIDENKILSLLNTSFQKTSKLDIKELENNINNRVTITDNNNTLSGAREAELIDLAFDGVNDGSGKKEKNCAKKEKSQDGPVTAETAAKRDAAIKALGTEIDIVADTVNWLVNDYAGKREWARIRRYLNAKDGELIDPTKTVEAAEITSGEGKRANIGRFRRGLLGCARTQINIERREATKTQNHYGKSKTQPIKDNPGGYDYDNLPDFNSSQSVFS